MTATDDTIDDDAETVVVTASHGGSPVGSPATITITDDDEAVWTVTAAPTSIGENGGVSTVTVRSTATYETPRMITLTLTGTAEEDADYTIGSKSLTLAAGDTEVSTTVTAVNDAVDEDNEMVTVTASRNGAARVARVAGAARVARNAETEVPIGSRAIMIIDDDTAVAPEWTVTASPARIAENGGVSTVTVSTGGATFPDTRTITLSLAGTATRNADYTIGSTTLTLAAGRTRVTTTVTAVDDTLDERSETVVVTANHGAQRGRLAGDGHDCRRRRPGVDGDGGAGRDRGDRRRVHGDGVVRRGDVPGHPDDRAFAGGHGDEGHRLHRITAESLTLAAGRNEVTTTVTAVNDTDRREQ